MLKYYTWNVCGWTVYNLNRAASRPLDETATATERYVQREKHVAAFLTKYRNLRETGVFKFRQFFVAKVVVVSTARRDGTLAEGRVTRLVGRHTASGVTMASAGWAKSPESRAPRSSTQKKI